MEEHEFGVLSTAPAPRHHPQFATGPGGRRPEGVPVGPLPQDHIGKEAGSREARSGTMGTANEA